MCRTARPDILELLTNHVSHPLEKGTSRDAADRRARSIMTYQFLAAVAIALGFTGTWLAAKTRRGWLLCIVSSTLWLPALATGDQWVAVANCALSIAICARNFAVQPDIRPTFSIDLTDEEIWAELDGGTRELRSVEPLVGAAGSEQ